MSFETLQRVAEAAGFAMASDENQSAEDGLKRAAEQSAHARTPGVLFSNMRIKADAAATVALPAAVWGRAHFGHLIPAWASKG